MSKLEFGLLLLVVISLPSLIVGVSIASSYDVSKFENCDNVYEMLMDSGGGHGSTNFDLVEASNNCKMLNHAIEQNEQIDKKLDWLICAESHKDAYGYEYDHDVRKNTARQYQDLIQFCGEAP